MRVLMDALQAGNRSGTGRYTVELARALARMDSGHSLRLAWPETLPFSEEGLSLLRLPDTALRRTLADQWMLPRYCCREGFEIIHYPANIGALRPGGVKSIVTVHDCSFCRHPEWFRAGRSLYYRFAMRQSARAATRVIADSNATARDLMVYAGLGEEKIDVIPLGVDSCFGPASAEACAAFRTRMGLPERFFLYVGTIEPRKNLERLIAAWSRHSGQPGFPDLVIAGRDGWKTGPVYEAAAASAGASRIHFPGFAAQEDLPTLLSAAEVFVWPSLFEGFGLPPLEAMACGTPVITSNSSSIPEVTGEAAVLVDPYDVGALSDSLDKVASDSALRAELRAKGLVRAAGFTWARTAELTLASYERAGGGVS